MSKLPLKFDIFEHIYHSTLKNNSMSVKLPILKDPLISFQQIQLYLSIKILI